METPFDYLDTTINGVSLSSAYKIGLQAGIKEVVEWLKLNEFDIYGSLSEWSLWQYKLKEWGLVTT